MDTNVLFDTRVITQKEAKELIDNAEPMILFSGSIDMIDENNVYVFNFVNGDTLLYILNRLKNNLDEVKIEIQTHVRDATAIQ